MNIQRLSYPLVIVAATLGLPLTWTSGAVAGSMELLEQDRSVDASVWASCGYYSDGASADGYGVFDAAVSAGVVCNPQDPWQPQAGYAFADQNSDISPSGFHCTMRIDKQEQGGSASAFSLFQVVFEISAECQYSLDAEMAGDARIGIASTTGAVFAASGTQSVSEVITLQPGTYGFFAISTGDWGNLSLDFQRIVPPCSWDLNIDGVVGVPDLLELLGSFGPCDGDCPEDFDDDGFVSVPDLLALIANFGPCPGSSCVWDVNGNGVVDPEDLQAVNQNLGPCQDPGNCPWDVNGDGVVDGMDTAAVATHFGPCP